MTPRRKLSKRQITLLIERITNKSSYSRRHMTRRACIVIALNDLWVSKHTKGIVR